MGIKINQYPLERLTFGDDDFYDIDYWDGATYQTAKIKGSTIKAGIESGILTIYDNDGTLSGARTVNMNNFSLGFLGGSVGMEHDLTVFCNDASKQWVGNFIGSSTNAILKSQNTHDNVGVGNSSPSNCAKLEVDSTDKGILIPRMNTTQRNNIPSIEESLMIYNTTTNQFEYVDSSLNWVALGGGDSIYTADGTLSGARLVDLDDNKLTFDVGTVASGTNPNIGLRVDGSNVYYGGGLNSSPLLQVDSDLGNVLNVNSGGYFIATSDYSTAIALFQKRGTNLGLSVASNKQAIGVPLIQHKPLLTSGSSQMIQQFVSSTLVDFQLINADGATGDNPNVKHWLRFGDSLSQASFFRTGFSGRGFIVGAQFVLGTEDISLQGETFIKGNDTLSTSTALAIYDGDTTPNKLWDFRNNGDIYIGTGISPTIEVDQSITFNFPATSAGQFIIDGTSQSASDSILFEVKSVGTGNSFNIDQKGEIKSTGITGTDILNIRNSSDTLGLNIKSGVSLFHVTQMLTRGAEAYSNGIRQVFSSTTEEMKWQQASSTDFNHQIKSGTVAGSNEVRFFNKGWSNSDGLVIGASSVIGSEDISLQGSVLINDDLDMNNNRITNAVINPSVQETASTASFTINANNETMGILTGMTQNVNVEAPTGTPVQGQKLMLRFKDDGTTRNFTWNIIWRAIGVTLPTATTANKTLYVGAVYNSTDSKWDVIAVKEEA